MIWNIVLNSSHSHIAAPSISKMIFQQSLYRIYTNYKLEVERLKDFVKKKYY